MIIPRKNKMAGYREPNRPMIPKEKKTAGYREVKETNNTPGTEVTGV